MNNSNPQTSLKLADLLANGSIVMENNQHKYKLPEEPKGAVRSFAEGFSRSVKGACKGFDECLDYAADLTCSGYDVTKEMLTGKKAKNPTLFDGRHHNVFHGLQWQ